VRAVRLARAPHPRPPRKRGRGSYQCLLRAVGPCIRGGIRVTSLSTTHAVRRATQSAPSPACGGRRGCFRKNGDRWLRSPSFLLPPLRHKGHKRGQRRGRLAPARVVQKWSRKRLAPVVEHADQRTLFHGLADITLERKPEAKSIVHRPEEAGVSARLGITMNGRARGGTPNIADAMVGAPLGDSNYRCALRSVITSASPLRGFSGSRW
jgi:hypothetical protein